MAEERSGDSSLQGRRQEKIESDGSSPSLGLPQVGVCAWGMRGWEMTRKLHIAGESFLGYKACNAVLREN